METFKPDFYEKQVPLNYDIRDGGNWLIGWTSIIRSCIAR